MKKVLFLLIMLMVTTFMFAQTKDSLKNKNKDNSDIKTLFDHPERGGFFSIYAGMTSITDRQALMAGLRFGTTLDHWLSYGLGGNFLISQLNYDNIAVNKSVKLEMGYGGLFIEPTLGPKLPFHLSFPILIGAGVASYNDNAYQNENNNWVTVDNDVFYVVEPSVDIEMNFTKHTRISLGVKYRYLSDLVLLNTKEDAFNGFFYGITLKFGKF